MTDEELRKLADAATPGPWEWFPSHSSPDTVTAWVDGTARDIVVDDGGRTDDEIEHDARFIAAARTAIPDLLNRVAVLELRLKEEEDWKARFQCDSEAYKQGYEDGMRALEKSIADKLDDMEPNRATAFKTILHVIGMLKE